MGDCERTEAMLIERSAGDLDVAEAAVLDAHLAACQACREIERQNELILGEYRAIEDVRPRDSVVARVLVTAQEPLAVLQPRRGFGLLLAAAAVILMGVLAANLLPRDQVLPSAIDVDLLVGRADMLVEEGRGEAAIGLYEQALEGARGGNHVAGILHSLTAVLIDQGDYDKALRYLALLESEVPNDPDRIAALLLQALAWEGKGMWTQALDAYNQVAVDFPLESEAALKQAQRVEVLREAEMTQQLQSLGYVR